MLNEQAGWQTYGKKEEEIKKYEKFDENIHATLMCALKLSYFTSIHNHITSVTKSKL